MKDKMKGLIVGLTIGSLLSGTAAFAASSQIDVAFRNLKYMFDGVEKAPAEGKGFIYEGSTYVPLKFVSEALGKAVEWDETNETIWIGSNPSHIVATYKGGKVTKGEFETYLALQTFFYPDYASSQNDPEFQQYIVKELIQNRILSSKASETDLAAAKDSASKQIAAWKTKITESAAVDQLKQIKLTEADLYNSIVESLSVQSYINSSISDEQLKAKYDEILKANEGAYTIASLRHILIGLNDSATQKVLRTKEEALARAKEVQQKLKNGEDFTSLAKTYSDDPGSKDNGGLYSDVEVSQWVAGFKKAAISLTLNTISDPVETEFGYHVMKVESRSVKTFDSVKAQIKNELSQEHSQAFMEKELPALIEKIDLGQ
ncbi:peptidylprolyl isomerase [Paenibacillus sp. SYP-B3998]|uniref:Peptidylprolyl isomerase n=1 Tax=Paenibacillus sp. SYP-B3998 TaxID=2678564 RepID=A0A6G3ZWP1_9BACL|nr:peptidylprolyl isomerase [Paenibacillus sp. SYP-B3998]NEW05991.1 peptidylprolyl isomerase [Paenibacillus sp. SYP-B3998]